MTESLLNINALSTLTARAPAKIVTAIRNASHKTGVDFAYLIRQAAAESSFDSTAESRSSSATGLYQFIESTWLSMVKKYGASFGLQTYADKIGTDGKVADPAARRDILALRKDPEKAALLAAAFADENRRYLERHGNGGPIGATELYLAHFMGAGGAAAFLKACRENPLATAADLFPKESRANRNVFYDRRTGEARTLAGVYDFFAKKFDAAPLSGTDKTAPPVARQNQGSAAASDRNNMGELIASMRRRTLEGFTGAPPPRRAPSATLPAPTLMLNPADLMLLAAAPLRAAHNDSGRYNS